MTTDKQRIAKRAELWKEIGNFLDCHTMKPGRSADELKLWQYCSQAFDGWREAAQSEQGWVSVSERLPDSARMVLVVLNGLHRRTGWYNSAKSGWRTEDTQELECVTHWQDYPAPPVHPESAQEGK